MPPLSSTPFLIGEFILWFVALPGVLALLKPHAWIYFLLWLLTALSCIRLEKHYGWNFHADWNFAGLNRDAVKAIVLRFIPFAIALFFFTWLTIPAHLFSLPREKPLRWIMIMFLYPPLSALPQEILFRTFIFRRFGVRLSTKQLILLSALAFGWGHIVLKNWVAVTFAFFGGLFFADTYAKTKSLAAVCFEHMLYGCTIFTLGLGFYFYWGSAVR